MNSEELKRHSIELLDFAGKHYPNQGKVNGIRIWHKALLSESDMPDGITNEELYVLFKNKDKPKSEFKVGQKVFADTETYRASCNISPIKIKQEVTISHYYQERNTYCCKEFNEDIAPYQLKKID